MTIIKTHAFGNDFLLLDEAEVPAGADRAAFARLVCDRHRGIGGDGLILFAWHPGTRAPGHQGTGTPAPGHQGTGTPAPGHPGTPISVQMSLLNADGSYSEVSGNGVRCLAAWIASARQFVTGAIIDVLTDAGVKRLELLGQADGRYTFRAAMGHPEGVARARITLAGGSVDAITLRVGNPQCVVLGDVTPERLHTVAAELAVHPHFPAGTNVELAAVEAPDRVRILIWERGVGPTEASGTGACAAAVAAMAFGGANRDVRVESPGGTQRVEWREEGLYLTGWAELTAVCDWRGGIPADA